MTGPVVATVQPSRSNNNIILTAMESYTSEYLLEKYETWKQAVSHKHGQANNPWYKVVVHGVPTRNSYDNSNNLPIISNEVRTFNPGLNPLGAPYWLTNAQKRAQQDAGSLVIAFGSENEFRNAIARKLMVCGVSCRVEKLYSSPPSVQCRHCLGFRHPENRCRNAYKYAICAGHPTITH